MLQVTALVFHFIVYLKKPHALWRDASDLTPLESNSAWIKTIQSVQLCKEIKILQTNRETSILLINQLGLFMDSSGIVSCRGRLGQLYFLPNTILITYLGFILKDKL